MISGIQTLIVFSLFLCLTSCQTPMYKDINKITVGMYKDQVLELVGSPKTSWRVNGTDRWAYSYFENDILQRKEVHFKNGQVIYFGEPKQASITAEEQDTINEKENAAIATSIKEDKAEAARIMQKYEEDPWLELKKKKKGTFVPVK